MKKPDTESGFILKYNVSSMPIRLTQVGTVPKRGVRPTGPFTKACRHVQINRNQPSLC